MRGLFQNRNRNDLEGILSWIYESTSRLEGHSNASIALHWFFLDSNSSRQKSSDGRPILATPYWGEAIEAAPFKNKLSQTPVSNTSHQKSCDMSEPLLLRSNTLAHSVDQSSSRENMVNSHASIASQNPENVHMPNRPKPPPIHFTLGLEP